MENNGDWIRQQRCERQADLAFDYADGLRARAELEDCAAADIPGLRLRVRRGSTAIDALMADLDGLIRHVLLREFGWRSDFDDLMQDARLHALEMIRIWKPGHGAALSSWVVMYLPQTLRRAQRKEIVHREDRPFSLDATRGLAESLLDDAENVDAVVLGDTVWFARELATLFEVLDPGDTDLVEKLLKGRPAELQSSERGRARAILAHPAVQLVGVADATGALDVEGSADWMDDAACAGMNVTEFFPLRGQTPSLDAKRACASCSARAQCLSAVASRTTWPGLWGGTSAKQRREIRERARCHGTWVEIEDAA